MNKKITISSNPKTCIELGTLMVVLSNPLLYLLLGSTIIDIKNLFGASIDKQSISFDTNDYFIQAMGAVAIVGFILVFWGLYLRRKSSKLVH